MTRASDVVTLPSARKCVSRRRFRIRLRRARGVKLVSATVHVNGKRVKVVRGRRLTSTVDLRALPKGRFKVRITGGDLHRHEAVPDPALPHLRPQEEAAPRLKPPSRGDRACDPSRASGTELAMRA